VVYEANFLLIGQKRWKVKKSLWKSYCNSYKVIMMPSTCALLLRCFCSILCSQSTICKHIFLMFLPTSWQQTSAVSNELINLIVDEAWNSSFTLLAAPWQHKTLSLWSYSSPQPICSSLFVSLIYQKWAGKMIHRTRIFSFEEEPLKDFKK
jgi:hypothetical protein